MNWSELSELLPIGVVMGTSLVVVFLSLTLAPKDRYVLPMLSMTGCLFALGVLGHNYYSIIDYYHTPPVWFSAFHNAAGGAETYNPFILNGHFAVDGFGMMISAVALLAGGLSTLCAPHTEEDSPLSSGEYYGLVLLAVTGMMLLGFAHDFLTLLISLEIMSVATYILAGAMRDDIRSTESALKYLVLGAFSSAFLMMGMAFVYGSTGRLSMEMITPQAGDPRTFLMFVGLALLLVGLLFKTGAVPFHAWVPDVYEGAPTGVTALMAVGVKAAAFAVVARVCLETFGHTLFRPDWTKLISILAVLTMALGNFLALHQVNVKRMLAYSGIAHTGYLLLAFLLDANAGPSEVIGHLHAVAFYLVAYGVMTLGAFGVVSLVREDGRPLERMEDFAGLAKEHPTLALCMATFMLSMAGMPPFAGFFAKFMIFRGAIQQGYTLAAVLGILTSVASLYYYLRVVVSMYMAPQGETLEGQLLPAARCQYTWSANLVIYGTGVATLLIGLFPNWVPGW